MGTDGSDEIVWTRSQGAEGFDPGAGNVLGNAAPARVYGCCSAGASVGEQDGSAIGDAHGARDVGIARRHDVALQCADTLGIVGAANNLAAGCVNLAKEEDVMGQHAEVAGGVRKVRGHAARIVANVDGKVQRVERGRADAAAAREECMAEAGGAQERRGDDAIRVQGRQLFHCLGCGGYDLNEEDR